MAFLLAGCGSTVQPLLDQATADCVASRPIPPNSYLERARCISDSTAEIVKTHQPPHADLLQLQEAYRLALAKKMDAGEISEEDAAVAFLEVKSQAISEMTRRDTSRSQARSAHIGAASSLFNSIGPVTCFSSGSTTTCY
jgi:hypothetical protein